MLLLELGLGCTILSGCATVRVPNVEWCSSIGAFGAVCQSSLSDDSRQLTLDEWLDWLEADLHINRGPALCVSSNDFTRLKIAIEQLCYKAGRMCTRETRRKLAFFLTQMNELQEDAKESTLIEAD